MSERVDKNIMDAGEPSDEEWLEFIKWDNLEQLMIDSDSLRLIVEEEINEQVEVIDLVDEQDDEVMEVNGDEEVEDANNSGEDTVIQEEIHEQVDVIDLVEEEVMEVNGEEEVEDANNSGEEERREKRKFDKRALLANCWTCFCWIEEGDVIWRCERRHVVCNLCKSMLNNSCSCQNPVNHRDTNWENFITNWDK